MNILVAIISTFAPRKAEKTYTVLLNNCSVRTVTACHTNESIFKTLIEMNEVKSNGGLDKIITLVSHAATATKNAEYNDATALEYYESIIREFSQNTKVETILTENKEIPEILHELCTHIKSDDVVYIDSAGGRRTDSNIIQLLIKLLKYKGIKNPYALYSDITNTPVISDTLSFTKMTDLLDAFNEFMTTGKSNKLADCLNKDSEYSNSKIKNLLGTMQEFSDKIQIGSVEKLDDTVKRLQINLQECETFENIQDIEFVILKEFLPVIREKLLGDTTKIDYAKIIRWCLENSLIQQALTLFVEKMPIYIFENEIIKYKGDINLAKQAYTREKKKTQPSDWETYVFYEEMMTEKRKVGERHPVICELLQNLKTNSSSNKKIREVTKELRKFEKDLKMYVPKTEIGKKIKNNIKGKGLKSFDEYIKKIKKGDMDSVYFEILGIKIDKEKQETTQKKFAGIQQISSGNWLNDDFFCTIDLHQMVNIFYGYIYVKALRNQVNHASSNENLTEEQKKILEQHGFISTIDIKSIQENLGKLLKSIEQEVKKIEVNKIKMEVETPLIPTTLNIGDIVMAKCVENKKVQIENHPYLVQLVVDRVIDSTSLLGKEFSVEVRQISQQGKLCQVKYIRE